MTSGDSETYDGHVYIPPAGLAHSQCAARTIGLAGATDTGLLLSDSDVALAQPVA
ncbi:MAG TPA: hypothetical protein VGW38_29410 [Chloroflexota bacterium]|nr:hypothetical protein [Chloroflexota bacterium]